MINNPERKEPRRRHADRLRAGAAHEPAARSLRAAAAKRLVDKIEANHDLLGTGFLGTPYLLEELTKAGYAKLAYTLLLNTRYPSWGYMVTTARRRCGSDGTATRCATIRA